MSMTPRALCTSRVLASGLLAALTISAAACGPSNGGTASAASAPAAAATAGAKLSANDATAEELQTIPGVGPEIAKEILEYRPYDTETGPDKFRDELAKYIDDAEIERIMTYLDFGA